MIDVYQREMMSVKAKHNCLQEYVIIEVLLQSKQIQQFISKYSLWGFIEETKKCAIQNAVIAQFILAKYYKIEFPNESVFWMEQFNNNPNGAEYVKREYKSMKASLPFDV